MAQDEEFDMSTISRSYIGCYQQCPRRAYWEYLAPNGTETAGWSRKKLAIPLVTGIYVHQGLEDALKGSSPAAAAGHARESYMAEVTSRGLAVEEGCDEANVVDEQAAHVEALVLAWCRVRLPKWQDEYEVVEVEVEDRVPLTEDVVLACRADAIVRRKADHRMFVVNFKTVANADDRWLKGWEVDMQLMTELLAAERRHGGQFGGVIIEGLIKGRRMPEKNEMGEVSGYRDSTPLLYGYKCDADPPLVPLQYSHEYTRRKGWHRFPVWKENFTGSDRTRSEMAALISPRSVGDEVGQPSGASSPLDYWIHWLPEEVVEGCFTIVPPIMRDAQRIESTVRQIIGMEHRIQRGMDLVNAVTDSDTFATTAADTLLQVLDQDFPQNFHSCVYPSRCSSWDQCFTSNVAEDPKGSGLYVERVDHHAPVEVTND